MTSITTTVGKETRQKPVATELTYENGSKEIISLDPSELRKKTDRIQVSSIQIDRTEVERRAGDETIKDGPGLSLRLSAVKALGRESLGFLKELNATTQVEAIRRATFDRGDVLSARRGREERLGQTIRT